MQKYTEEKLLEIEADINKVSEKLLNAIDSLVQNTLDKEILKTYSFCLEGHARRIRLAIKGEQYAELLS